MKRKFNKTPTSDQNFGPILEDMDSKLDLILEGYNFLVKGLDGVIQRLDIFEKKFGNLELQLDNKLNRTEFIQWIGKLRPAI